MPCEAHWARRPWPETISTASRENRAIGRRALDESLVFPDAEATAKTSPTWPSAGPPSRSTLADTGEAALASHGRYVLAMGGMSGIHRYQDFRDPTAHPLQRYQQKIFLTGLGQQLENTSTTTLTLTQGMVSHSDFTILEFQ